MRKSLDKARLENFFKVFASKLPEGGRIYITGGTSAILKGWRDSTIDVDLSIEPSEPEPKNFFIGISEVKEELNMNIELASPADFIPPLPGWELRSQYITTEKKTDYYHFDFYTQAFSKIARDHERDRLDVRNMLQAKLIEPDRLLDLFHQVADQLLRYPSLSAPALSEKVHLWHHSQS